MTRQPHFWPPSMLPPDHDPLRLGYPMEPHHYQMASPLAADRVTRIEIEVSRIAQAITYSEQVMRDRGTTIGAHDERIRKMGSRLGKLEDSVVTMREQTTKTALQVEKLSELPSRLDAEKARTETLLAIAKVGGGFLLVAAASALKISPDVVLKLLGK